MLIKEKRLCAARSPESARRSAPPLSLQNGDQVAKHVLIVG